VIDATIDHEAGVLISSGSADTYSTLEPQALQVRLSFTLPLSTHTYRAAGLRATSGAFFESLVHRNESWLL